MTSDPNGWPFPEQPGVPLNPEQDGWHWLDAGGPVLCEWRASRGWMDETWWPHAADLAYLGLCLPPAEVAALVAEAEAQGREAGLREAAGIAEAESSRGGFNWRGAATEIATAILARIKEAPHG